MKSTVVDESLSTTTTRVLFQRKTTCVLMVINWMPTTGIIPCQIQSGPTIETKLSASRGDKLEIHPYTVNVRMYMDFV